MAEKSNTTHTEVPADGHKAVFSPFDSSKFEAQLVWLAITFIILYVVISRMALPRIGEVLEERQDRIQRDMDEANRLKEETDKAIANYEEALATARQKANGIAEETRAKLKSLKLMPSKKLSKKKSAKKQKALKIALPRQKKKLLVK